MVQHWSPRSQVQQAITPNEWFMHDRSRKIAIIRLLDVGGFKHKLFRSVTYSPEPSNRFLIGYFPTLDMAAWYTWQEWVKQNPSTSDRK